MADNDGTKELRVISGGLDVPQDSEPREAKGSYRSAKLANGLTQKQDRFAVALSEGATNAEAYRVAFGAEGYAMRTLHSKACALAARDDIKARVAELLAERRVKKQHVDAQAMLQAERVSDRVFRNLWKIAEDDATPAAARVSALQLAAKASGMLVDRVETKSLNAPADIEAELRARLAKFTGTDG